GNSTIAHVNGTGNVGINAGTGTIYMSSSPLVDGTFDVTGGTFSPFVPITQTINVHGNGQLRQAGDTDGLIMVYGHGSTRPIGSQPGTLTVGQISFDNGFHVVDVAPTPGVYSKIVSNGPITFSSTALQINLSTTPNPGDTISNIFTTTSSVTG